MLVPLVPNLGFLCLWLSSVALAQRDCDRDGETSTYSLNGLIVPFDNLCGRDIEDPTLDFGESSEQRRSDCIARCVRQAPLCYGFDYSPYYGPTPANCYLKKDSFPESNATYRGFVADAGMLNPKFLAQLPEHCKSLGLRGCFELYGPLGGFSTAGSASPTASATPTAPSSSSSSSGASTTGDQQEASGGLSTGAKAGIGAGAGLAALTAILCGVLFSLRRVKRKRATAPSATVLRSNAGDAYPPHKAEPQIHACVATGGLELAEPRSTEQVHEIDGGARHEL